jgi:hypothetical protein
MPELILEDQLQARVVRFYRVVWLGQLLCGG